MAVSHRPATNRETTAIADLHARSWRATYRGWYSDEYLDGPIDDDRLAVWTQRLDDPPPNQIVLVAEEDGGIVGFACAYGAHDDEWGSFLDNLHTDPARHGEGIGTGLFRAVVEWCRERYPTCGLHLSVVEQNTNARRFYERFGGVDSGTTEPSSPWIIEGVRIKRYAWPTLATVSDNAGRKHWRWDESLFRQT